MADEHTLPIEATWKDWQPSEKLVSTEATLVIRSEVDDNNDTLVVVHHSELGPIGLWSRRRVECSFRTSTFNENTGKTGSTYSRIPRETQFERIVAVETMSLLLFSAPK